MTKYIIIETVKSEKPEDGNFQLSVFFDSFEEAQEELQDRYNKTADKSKFNQSISTREI